MIKILISKINDILSEDLSVEDRGLLITLLLLKEPDPKMTYAKFKVKVKVSEYSGNLIRLHELGFIDWGGYTRAKKSIEEESYNPDVEEAITFFNNLCGRKFDHTSENTVKNLRARLKDYSLDEVKSVISNRFLEWNNDPVMVKHLNPTTLFRPSKFEKYLEETKRTKKGVDIVNAEKITLKKGDVITIENSQEFIDEDLYPVVIYDVFIEGVRSNPVRRNIQGKKLKRLLIQERKKNERGEKTEFEYVYDRG